MEFAFKMEFQAFMQILTDRLYMSKRGEGAINISDKKFYSKWLNLVHNYPLDRTTNINELRRDTWSKKLC